MSYLDRINTCNTFDLDHFRPFRVENMRVGWVKHAFAEHLQRWPEIFQIKPDGVELSPHLHSFAERTQAMEHATQALVAQGIIERIHGEKYPVTPSSRDQALLLADRASAPYFGIRAFGQHMNGFVREGKNLKMWLGRRAHSKHNAPGKLDNTVAGGLPHAMALQDNLVKECWEEAAIPPEWATRALPVGAVSYCLETREGLKPDVIFCYDLELPADFVPRCTDGEVAAFYLWPIEQVAEIVRETDEVKKNCNLVIIDFLIRHGYITPRCPDYGEVVTGLHRPT